MNDQRSDAVLNEDGGIPEALLQEELGRMVASRHFRTSRRCKEFLQYVVKQKLTGNGGLLKERLIGVEIFGRKPDYPVGEDPVVRVLAGDVRHRLERYHADIECHSDIVIEIPLGSYAPVFRVRKDRHTGKPVAETLAMHERSEGTSQNARGAFAAEPTDPKYGEALQADPLTVYRNPVAYVSAAAADQHLGPHVADSDPAHRERVWDRVPKRYLKLSVGTLVLVLGILGWLYHSYRSDATSRFWQPASTAAKPVLLWLPKPMVYRPSDALFEKYEREHPNTPLTREARQDRYLPLEPDEALTWADIVPIQDSGPGIGGVIAALNMSRLLTEQGIRFKIRFGPEANYVEMRDSPAVIVGAINSDWATQLTSESHFAFDESIGAPSIYETTGAKRVWKLEVNHGHKTRDYGLITRQLSGKSGQFVVQVAGISHFGTEAASEFLLEEGALGKILRAESISLQKRNLQIIVSTDITNEHAGPPQVVSVSSW